MPPAARIPRTANISGLTNRPQPLDRHELASITARDHPEGGFTLVEVMVAMVIGMLGLIIMMQVFSEPEGNGERRPAPATRKATAPWPLYALQRDIRQGVTASTP
jgi:prepilin-type N-terminal cleavage/methylation domain-containing protein